MNSNSYKQNDIFYKKKYYKYKKKYINLKNEIKDSCASLDMIGGGKRYLKGDNLDKVKVNKEDIMTITPIGSPTVINTWLLQPEIDFISKKCSKDKKLKKFCKSENISKIITEVYRFQQNGDNFKKNIDEVSKNSKLSKEFILSVFKEHETWKQDKFLRFDKK